MNMGNAYKELEKINIAIKYYEDSLKLMYKIYYELHPDIATNFINMGEAYHK